MPAVLRYEDAFGLVCLVLVVDTEPVDLRRGHDWLVTTGTRSVFFEAGEVVLDEMSLECSTSSVPSSPVLPRGSLALKKLFVRRRSNRASMS